MVFLTLYFSNILSDPGAKRPPYRDAFLVSFLGSAAGAAFSLIVPTLPRIVPHLDVAVSLVIVTWILLLHFHYEAGWLEATLEAGLGALIYVVILAIASGFFMLWTGGW